MMPSTAEINSMTPMMRQYYELKGRCSDAVLFFRMGDFYEIFGSDAEKVAPVLELVLTSRERGDQTRIPFCGVPHHSARNYWLKLLRKGYKVALADQLENPEEAKGLVRRDIVRIFTPGCIDDLEGLETDSPNYLMGIYEDPQKKLWAMAICDISTGEIRLGNGQSLDDVRALVEQYKPKELLARRFFHLELETTLARHMGDYRLLLEALPEAALRDTAQQKALFSEVFGKSDLGSQPCGKVTGGEALLAALLTHLKNLQASLNQFLTIRPLHEPNTMTLHETATRDLELFETARRRQTEGSVFHEINQTISPMGARLLRYTLGHPLLDAKQIQERHGAVRSFLKLGETELSAMRGHLQHFPDLERLTTRIFAGSASPAELEKTYIALEKAQWIIETLTNNSNQLSSEIFHSIITGLKFSKGPHKTLSQALERHPRSLGTGLGVFLPGYDQELDTLNELSRGGEAKVDEYQDKLRQTTGINSLKIKAHKSLGLLIEITKTNLDKVPSHFIRRQTMVNCERFVTVELEELSVALDHASERAVARERELYEKLLQELGKFRIDLRSVAYAVASFDMLQSFAWQALKQDYCEPKLADDRRLELKGSRHPVIERFVGRHQFVPNDLKVTPAKKHLLITGPNMAGKSTVMRQTALAAILNQIGSFVPAQSARLPIFDQIFTRVGAADDLSRGQSTFMVEMSEAAQILRDATPKSLVILDEVGRGTSTQDGLAIASAILEDLAQRLKCYSFFATHYHELVPLAQTLPSVRVMQTEVLEQEDRIVFTHRLKEGACDSSYGIEVARIAGLPESVLVKAKHYLQKPFGLEADTAPALVEIKEKHSAARAHKARAGATAVDTSRPLETKGLGLVASHEEQKHADLVERLMRLNLNRTTPLQALNFIKDLQDSLEHRPQPVLFPEESC